MSWLWPFGLREKKPDSIQVRFRPLEDITAFELAAMVAHGWPVLVNTASGLGTLMYQFHVQRSVWDKHVSAGIKRHFELV